MKKILVLSTLLCLVCGLNNATFGLSIDGDNSDWLSSPFIHNDALDAASHNNTPLDLTRWGATIQTDNGVPYLYMYFEATNMSNGYNPANNNNIFLGSMIDVDRKTGALTWGLLPGGTSDGGNREGYKGNSCIGHDDDNAGPEFFNGHHNGYDTQIELGYRREGFNFWGGPNGAAEADDAWYQGSAITPYNSTTYAFGPMEGNYGEFKVKVSDIINEVKGGWDYNRTAADKVKIGSLWKVGVRVAARFRELGGSEWIAADKSGNAADLADASTPVYVYIPVLQGDLDENGKVEYADFVTLKQNFGKSFAISSDPEDPMGARWCAGDLNMDGVVDYTDFVALKTNFGKTRPDFGTAGVPEPMTLALFGLGAFLLRKRG